MNRFSSHYILLFVYVLNEFDLLSCFIAMIATVGMVEPVSLNIRQRHDY